MHETPEVPVLKSSEILESIHIPTPPKVKQINVVYFGFGELIKASHSDFIAFHIYKVDNLSYQSCMYKRTHLCMCIAEFCNA